MRLLAQNLVRRGVVPFIREERLGAIRLISSMTRNSSIISSSFRLSSATPSRFSFSSTAQSEILDILAREEQEEVNSGNMELSSELAELKSSIERDWRIVDDGSAMTQLFLKNKKVQLSFHCQDTIEEEENEVYDENEEEEPSPPVRFTVTVSKAGKTLVVNCISEFGEGKIEGVTTTSSSPDIIHSKQGVVEKSEYQGPDFLELAEDLQEAFGIYFEEDCLITTDVAAFVAMYADYKEQQSYVQFLKDAQSIIS